MTDLLGAASRIDDVARGLDRMFANPELGFGGADRLRIPETVNAATTQLAAAMPTGLGTELRSFYIPYDAGLTELARIRSQLSHLGAVTRAVHQLGGVDHVVSQGGLDAIDGAADVIRRHVLLDAAEQLRAVTIRIEDRPFGISMSGNARREHMDGVRRALVAPMHTLEQAGIVPVVDEPLAARMLTWRSDGSKPAYEQLLREADATVRQVRGMDPATMPAPSTAWTEAMLPSDRARAIATENAARSALPTAPRLSMLADDAAVLSNALAALDQHVATLEALEIAVGSARHHDPAFRAATSASRGKLDRAVEDLVRLEAMAADAPDGVRRATSAARDWVAFLASEARTPTNGMWGNHYRMLPASLEQVRDLRNRLEPVAAQPDLLRAGTDVAEELQEVLARPGNELDLTVVRDLVRGEAASSANLALVEHLPRLKPHGTDVPRTSDTQDALRLLDEAETIGDSIAYAISKGDFVPEDRMLDDPAIIAAADELFARTDTALGTMPLVTESKASSLASHLEGLRALTHHAKSNMYGKPDGYRLKEFMQALRSYRNELTTVTERAQRDGGLRSIAPSARPAQAAEARGRWIFRELDALTTAPAPTTSAEHVEAAARRATMLHELVRVAKGMPEGPARATLMERASTEYQALGETWRMPDDVALSLWRLRDDIQRTGTLDISRQLNTTLPGYNTEPGIDRARDIAAGLQAWAMFTDGPLPETVADRLSVAARRGAAVRDVFDQVAARGGEDDRTVRLADSIADLRLRIAAVEDIADGVELGPTRAGLEEMFDRLQGEVGRRNDAFANFDKPGPAPADTFSGRAHLDAWVAALEDAHRTTRATASERLSW